MVAMVETLWIVSIFNNYIDSILNFIIMRNREQLTALKLRNTLHQLKQFCTKPPPQRTFLQSPPIGITLLSLQPYRNKRKVQQRTNRENIENQLKVQIFKKIRETMQSRSNYNGLEIAKVTMHSSKNKPATAQKSDRMARRKRMIQGSSQRQSRQNRCLRIRTQNTSTYRPYESSCQYYPSSKPRKLITSQRKIRTDYNQQTDLNGWNINSQEEDFNP